MPAVTLDQPHVNAQPCRHQADRCADLQQMRWVVPLDHHPHKLDGQHGDDHADHCVLEFVQRVDAQPGRHVQLADKEAIQPHGDDIEHRAGEELLDKLHDRHGIFRLRIGGKAVESEGVIQKDEQPKAAGEKQICASQKQADHRQQDNVARLRENTHEHRWIPSARSRSKVDQKRLAARVAASLASVYDCSTAVKERPIS